MTNDSSILRSPMTGRIHFCVLPFDFDEKICFYLTFIIVSNLSKYDIID